MSGGGPKICLSSSFPDDVAGAGAVRDHTGLSKGVAANFSIDRLMGSNSCSPQHLSVIGGVEASFWTVKNTHVILVQFCHHCFESSPRKRENGK